MFFADDYDPTGNFTQVPNHWAYDFRLSLKAKGLLLFFKIHKPGWRLTLDQMIAESTDGKDSVYSALKELKKYEYVIMERLTEKGRVVSVSYRWGPAAVTQGFERVWKVSTEGNGIPAGQTTSGKPGSGDESGTSAGQTTSGFAGSGFSGSGESAPNNTNKKNTKDKKTKNPPLTPPVDETAAAEPDGTAQERGGDSSQNKTPTMEQVVDWFAKKRPDWKPAAIRLALEEAMRLKRGDLTECARALRELVENEAAHGQTKSPWRLPEDREWWKPGTAVVPRQQQGPRCQKMGHAGPEGECKQCAVEARAARSDDQGAPVDPAALQRHRERLEAAAARGSGSARKMADRLASVA